MSIAEMIKSHPQVAGNLNEPLATAVRHAMFCTAICTSCADACLAEEDVAAMRQCIRNNLDCADICDMLFKVATRRTGSNEALIQSALRLCIEACIDPELEWTECAKTAMKLNALHGRTPLPRGRRYTALAAEKCERAPECDALPLAA